jgi:hypothetical protein
MKVLPTVINNGLECPYLKEDVSSILFLRCGKKYNKQSENYEYIGTRNDIEKENIIPVWCPLDDVDSLLDK